VNHTTNPQALRAVLTVTAETRPDGGHYFDQADFVAYVTEWVRAALKDKHAISEVTIVDQAAELARAQAEAHQYRTALQGVARRAAEPSVVVSADRATLEAERDSLGREADRLRKDWVEMRTRAERAEAEVRELRRLSDGPSRVAAEEQPTETQWPGERCGLCPPGTRTRHVEDHMVQVHGARPTARPAETQDGGDLADRLEAALTERFTELGNPFSEMRRHEQGPDGWPASHPVGPNKVAEVLRELMAEQPAVKEQPAKCTCEPAPHRQQDGSYSHWVGCSVADAEQQAAEEQPAETQDGDRAALRERIAEALMRWAERNNSSQYASMRRPETVRQNAYSRADAVLDALSTPATCGAREPEPRTGTSPCVLPAGHGGAKHQDKWTNQWPAAEQQP
jgi:hypothetical protein